MENNTKTTRRSFLKTASAVVAAGQIPLAGHGTGRADAAEPSPPTVRDTFGMIRDGKKIPVIYDSDIGDDIDDTWALGMLLKCPEFDVKLVVGDQGKASYRTKLFAKFLQRAGRTDIPIGIGLDANRQGSGPQSKWIEGYDLKAYPGKVLTDGVGAIVDTIMHSPRPVTLIAVGPVPNVAAALKRQPKIAARARFVGMHGSVRLGYGGGKKISAEYNVRADAKACQAVFAAPWEVTITPLDTCGIVQLSGQRYQRVRDSKDPVASGIIENYRIWHKSGNRGDPSRAEKASSTLYDTVAVYLGFSEELLKMETLGIRVTDDGYTRIDPTAKPVRVATGWKDLDAFKELLARKLQ